MTTTAQTLKEALFLKGTEGECNIYFKEKDSKNVWGNMSVYRHTWSEETPYFISPLLSFGNYDNSCHIERSNLRVFREEHAETEGKDWIYIYGGHGSEAIAIKIDTTNEAIINDMLSLENYPCLSDEDASETEREMINDSIDFWLLSDLQKEINKNCNYDDSDPDEEELKTWMHEVMEENNIYPSIEAGGNVYIPINEIAAAAPEDMPTWYKGERSEA